MRHSSVFVITYYFIYLYYFIAAVCASAIGSSTSSSILQSLIVIPSSSSQSSSKSYKRIQSFTQNEAIHIIDNILFPKNEYKQRLKIARNAQFKEDKNNDDRTSSGARSNKGQVLSASDPILSFTYDEFPPLSMDQLLDLAIDEYKQCKLHNNDGSLNNPNVFVDLGSGCGRLVLYAALCKERRTYNDREDHEDETRQLDFAFQHVHGIEISPELNNIGINSLEIGVKEGFFVENKMNSNHHNNMSQQQEDGYNDGPTVQLHLGDANQLTNVLHQADIIFSYSTVFPTKGFDENLGAMILADEWSKMLADTCKKGCVVVTTDRALNPLFGWELKQSLSVENPKLFGTIGYVSILR